MITYFKLSKKSSIHPPGMFISWPSKTPDEQKSKAGNSVFYLKKTVEKMKQIFLPGKT
jgi:hypothetical protein